MIQPVRWVHGTPVYWSVGNLVSGMGCPATAASSDERTLDGLLASVRFTESTTPGVFHADPWAGVLCSDRYAPHGLSGDDRPRVPVDATRSTRGSARRVHHAHPRGGTDRVLDPQTATTRNVTAEDVAQQRCPLVGGIELEVDVAGARSHGVDRDPLAAAADRDPRDPALLRPGRGRSRRAASGEHLRRRLVARASAAELGWLGFGALLRW